MIISEYEQGTEGWKEDRLGKFTASCFNKILGATQLKNGTFTPSKDIYFYKVASERLTGEPYFIEEGEERKTYAMERGCDLENKAIKEYEFMKDTTVKKVGFCTPDKDALYGASPDGLVGEEGGLEVKSPELFTHLKYCAEQILPMKYVGQVYGCLFVSERKWWDFMSYHPYYEAFIIRINSDDKHYLDWKETFAEVLDKLIVKLRKYEPLIGGK